MSRLQFRVATALIACAISSGQQNVSISLNSASARHRYDGHGALSAGASSRLLWDYQEPYRAQVLDYLFNVSFGASLHLLKLEIGGDGQSTDGTEVGPEEGSCREFDVSAYPTGPALQPSHMHSRDDLSCSRGYELWLMREAKARNPAILVYGLSWAVPAWVGDGTYYSEDNIAYQTAWVACMARETGFHVDYLGLWNEKPQPASTDYVVALRSSLDAAGAASTRIIVMDGGYDADEVAAAQANATYRTAIHGAGLHYPCRSPHPEVRLGGRSRCRDSGPRSSPLAGARAGLDTLGVGGLLGAARVGCGGVALGTGALMWL